MRCGSIVDIERPVYLYKLWTYLLFYRLVIDHYSISIFCRFHLFAYLFWLTMSISSTKTCWSVSAFLFVYITLLIEISISSWNQNTRSEHLLLSPAYFPFSEPFVFGGFAINIDRTLDHLRSLSSPYILHG